MGVCARLAALAVFATAGSSGLFTRRAGTAGLFGGAADVSKGECEKTDAEEDGFHICDSKGRRVICGRGIDAIWWVNIPKPMKKVGFTDFPQSRLSGVSQTFRLYHRAARDEPRPPRRNATPDA
jgi:hypothetical protein